MLIASKPTRNPYEISNLKFPIQISQTSPIQAKGAVNFGFGSTKNFSASADAGNTACFVGQFFSG
jgi:hypothetical protein